MATALALGSAWVLVRLFGAPAAAGRYAAIDGLRGYLAFFVFLHHAATWYFYLRTGQWSPQTYLYEHLGQGSVFLFFMITGFLFWSKLLNGRQKPIDWQGLYVSRLCRLTPLYLFAMLVLFTIVACVSGFALAAPPDSLLLNAGKWLSYCIFGEPDLNGVHNTTSIMAGVTWTLSYEWAFYGALPLFALLLRVRVPWPYIGIGILAAIFAYERKFPPLAPTIEFLGGILAAHLVRRDWIRDKLAGTAGAVLALACIAASVCLFPTPYSKPVTLLFSIAFAVVASGNGLFGILTSNAARFLGEISYSIYLLHGFVLYILFQFVVGMEKAASLTAMQHWLLVCGCVPILILISAVTFRWIEAPWIRLGPTLNLALRRSLGHRTPRTSGEQPQ